MKKNIIYFLGVLFICLLVVLFYFLYLRADLNDKPYLKLRIDGKEYDALYLVIHTTNRGVYEIEGITEDGQNWLFLYSDSIHERHLHMSIRPPENDYRSHILSFYIPRTDQDTLKIGNFSFERQSTIHAQFIRTERNSDRFREWVSDIFLVSYDNDKELSSIALVLIDGYNWFNCSYLSYEEQLQRYVDMTIANPTSHALIAAVATSLFRYRNIDDIKKIFSHFSEENRESYFGGRISQHIYRYMNMAFENFYLPAWDTNQLEPVIQDTTKYTLVIFSASWCAACHRLTPVLKEIYSDLYNYLNIVYISIDEQETVQWWKDRMIEKEIPWRSLLAVDNAGEIMDRYLVMLIPDALLIHPNGKLERLGADVMRVYEVVRGVK